MTEIIDRTQDTSLAGGDQVSVYSAANGDVRRFSLTTLLAWMQANLSIGVPISQFSSPSATGFTVTLAAVTTWLILTPLAGYAAGTIVLPPLSTDGFSITVICTQSVTTLTISAPGTSLVGMPTTLAANGFFRVRYSAVTNTWYRID